jgi:hypothetical protein
VSWAKPFGGGRAGGQEKIRVHRVRLKIALKGGSGIKLQEQWSIGVME